MLVTFTVGSRVLLTGTCGPARARGGGGLLAPDNSALNSHTYVYEPDKSLRKMTIEALPTADNYQVLTLSDA